MKRMFALAALVLAALAARPAAGSGPWFDPFAERFAVGAHRDPGAVALVDGWPDGLWEPARPDTSWLAARRTAPLPRADALSAAHPAGRRLPAVSGGGPGSRWRVAAPDPCTGALATIQAAFDARAAGRDSAARGLARDLAADVGLTDASRVVWSLRAASLAPETTPVWPAADSLIAVLGPADAAHTWALAVALRRARGQAPVPSGAPDAHGRALGRLADNFLTPEDLESAPYAPDVVAALGAVSLRGDALEQHLARHPTPPTSSGLQGWWLRGQRRAAAGDPGAYERLARRNDLRPHWRMDLWRRASERRLLTGAWSAGIDDLARALALARDAGLSGALRDRLHVWTEQALVLALARARVGDADRVLALAEEHLADAPDADLAVRLAPWGARLAGEDAPPPADVDRVALSRHAVRTGAVADARRASTDDRRRLLAEPEGLWMLWRRWGLALTTQPGIPADRLAAARAYHDALAAATSPAAALAAAMGRLARRDATVDALLVFATDRDVRDAAEVASAPRPSPLPDLVAEHRRSQADLHALLGVALYLRDMRGQLAAAMPLPAHGLTRDEKRRFLYPLPGPGALRDALLAADNDPALLLAIARNESLFEPAARSRAGALGWMQIMPFHFPERGALPGAEHWSRPAGAVARGDRLVTENRRRYRGDPYRLLAAYNAGPGAAKRWDEQLGGGADRAEFLAWIGYTETRAYVEKVLIDKIVYAWILDGAPGAAAPEPTEE